MIGEMGRAPVIAVAVGTLLAVLVGAFGLGGSNGSDAKLPAGNRKGVALIAQAARRLSQAPGLRIDIGPISWIMVVSFESGTVTAQQLEVPSPWGEYIYLARPRQPTYEYVPSRHCWLRNPPGAFLFNSVGRASVTSGLASVEAPTRVRGGWTLRATPADAPGEITEFQISDSYVMEQATTRLPNGKRIIERFQTLTAAPRIPPTRPVCRGLMQS